VPLRQRVRGCWLCLLADSEGVKLRQRMLSIVVQSRHTRQLLRCLPHAFAVQYTSTVRGIDNTSESLILGRASLGRAIYHSCEHLYNES
jgi:hypothetical protein